MENKYFDKIHTVYESLIDEKSKNTFKYRLLYNLTNDALYLMNIIKENSICHNAYSIADYYIDYFMETKKGENHKKLIIYGAFNSGILRYDFSKYLGIDDIFCFCDKDFQKQKDGLFGKKVISPEELIANHKDAMVLIETKYHYDEVYDYLIKSGFPKQSIISHVYFGKQYFDKDIIKLSDSEVFVDCGCYNGDTLADFIEECNEKYEKVYAFDADENNYLNCYNFICNSKLDKIDIVNKGVWDKSEQLCFDGGKGISSCIVEESSMGEVDIINTISLDEYIGENKVTFIKMDIEGAELRALEGAKKLIERERPKLAICIYHKKEDILNIPIYLKELVPDYKFAIRHYAGRELETVLYAI